MEVAGEPDVRAALRLVHDLDSAAGTAAVRDAVLRGLRELVPCDSVVWSLAADGEGADLVLQRAGGGFGEAELALLELLRPHLLAAVRRAAVRERLAGAHLTPREIEVLAQVETGDANVLIAQRLGMRPRTVEKHLEHAYAKLGVCSRTAAVARLREITH